jgi:hypothetical protein
LDRNLHAGRPDQRGEFPVARLRVVAQHERPAIVDFHLEVAVIGSEPVVEDFEDGRAPPTQLERARLFLTTVACEQNPHTHNMRWRICSESSTVSIFIAS